MKEAERPLRLFVAVDVPLEQRRLLQEAVEPHKESFKGARWTAVESQHVTLKFLGNTPLSAMDALKEVLVAQACAARRGPVRIWELGVFPGMTRARVLWAGLDDPGSVLRSVAEGLDVALEELGYGVEKRSFTPHLTLARFKAPIRLDAPLPALPVEDLAPFDVASIALYSSRLHPHGARYEPVATYALGGDVTVPRRDANDAALG